GTGTAAAASFFVCAQVADGQGWGRALARVPAALLVGTGLSLNNARAVLEGLGPGLGRWERTPKRGFRSRATPEKEAPAYRPARGSSGVGEALLTLYFLATAALAIRLGRWDCLPFLGLLTSGFGYVSWLSLRAREWAGRSPARGHLGGDPVTNAGPGACLISPFLNTGVAPHPYLLSE